MSVLASLKRYFHGSPAIPSGYIWGRTDAGEGKAHPISIDSILRQSVQTVQNSGIVSGTTFANPTAMAGPAAVNGVATTAMRSDAAPAVQMFGAAQAGLTPLSGGGTTNFLRADGSWVAPPGNTYQFDTFFTSTGITKPTNSSFTLVQNGGGTATSADLASGRGVQLVLPSTGGNSMAILEQNAPSSSAFTAIMMVSLMDPYQSSAAMGIGVVDNAGKIAQFGGRNSGSLYEQAEFDYSSIGNFSGSTTNNDNWVGMFGQPIWIKLVLASNQFTEYLSYDGETWIQVYQVSSTAFLGSTLSKVGPMHFLNNSGKTNWLDIWSWKLTTP